MSQHYNSQSQPKARVLPAKARYIDLLVIYGAFGLITAIVFGTVLSHSF